MKFSQDALLIFVALALSGCLPPMPLLMVPAQYLGLVIRDQCYIRVVDF